MPTLKSDFEMHYLVDDFTDPWTQPESILLIHGNSESSAAWYAWVPLLARRSVPRGAAGIGAGSGLRPRCRVIFRGPWTSSSTTTSASWMHSASSAFTSSAANGGMLARALAARRPERVRTLTLIGTPPAARSGGEGVPKLVDEYEKRGVRDRLRRTMGKRLGVRIPQGRRRGPDRLHVARRRVEPHRLQRNGQLRRHQRRDAQDQVPDAGHHHRRERPRVGRREPRVAATDSELEAAPCCRGIRIMSR